MFGRFFGWHPAFAGCHGPHPDHPHHHRPGHRWRRSEMRGRHRGGGRGFGVRRPLRFMARQLDLDDDQVAELAIIIDDLKTERAQAGVDHRRAIAAFADAFQSDTFDQASVQAAANARAESAKRVQDAVVKALERTHAVLDEEQRPRLALLLRSGTLEI